MATNRQLATKLTPEEKAALEEFSALVDSIPNKPENDYRYYLRWLRARKFNVKRAVEMFRKHMEYRARFRADEILEEWTPPEVLVKCFPGGFFGEDRGGHPVWYDNMGNLDYRGLHRSAKKEDILKYKCMQCVLCDKVLKDKSVEEGRYIETISCVLDFENLSFQKHYYWPGLEILKDVLEQVMANSPERIEQVFIIRAPAIFSYGYNLIKHIFDENTRKKILIFGADWKEDLQKYISPDQLPQVYGGTRREPDSRCSDYINHGCDVPQEYYFTNLTEKRRDDMDRVTVGRGRCHELVYEVTQEGSILQWEFITSEYDIGFGISLSVHGNAVELLPLSRYNSHLEPEVGQHCCQLLGKYVLKFDNSFSWTRCKEVYYSIKLQPPAKTLAT